MTEKGKSIAAWNECIGQLKGSHIKRQDAQTVSLTLNEFLEAKFQGTSRKVPYSAANQVGIKYGIDPALLTSVKKSAEQYIIARSGQVIYGENAFDLSGWSTDISEDGLTLAVGSILNDGVSGLIGDNRGSVRVYSRSNVDDPWIQKGVDIDGEAAQDYSGWSVSLSADGDRVVIGAVFNDTTNENVGHVRVYDWNSSSSQWGQVGVDIVGGAAGDFFGYSVSLSKNKNFLAIGAPYGGNTVGYVRVYQDNNGTWDQIDVDQTGSEKGDLFGKHVALSDDGSRLVVSSPNAVQLRGHVHLYRVDSTITLLTSKMGRDSGVRFGNSFDFKSNILAVSETGTNQPNITTYDTSSDSFDTLQNNRITLTATSDIHLKLSYDGNNLVFGMPGFNSEDLVLNSRPIPRRVRQTGHAEIYEREENKWVSRGWRMKGVSARDEFAKSVAISGNGEVVCLSVPRKDDGGTDRGCVSAYTVKPISHYVTPTITLTGLNPFPLQANTSYEEPGATTDTGASVTISGDIEDNTVEGQEYEILYTSQNGFGSVVTKTRRIIITKDPTIPTMTLNGDAIASIPLNGVFNDPGVTTSILSTVNIDDSNVDITRLGTYEIKYTAVSSYGIPSQQDMRRTLVVVYDTEHHGEPLVGRVTSMSRDGFILAVGDFTNNSVKLYEWDPVDQDWKRIGQEIEGPDDSSFGAAVDVSSDGLTVVIGAPQYSGTTSLSGLVRVYRYSFIVDQWEQVGDDINDGQVGDNLGEFVTISGDGTVVSCGNARPTGSEKPYVFTYRYGTTWTKFHTYTEPIKLGNNIVKKQFSGSLNFNGSRLLLGVPVNNYTTGAVFLYDTEDDEKLVSIVGEQVGDNIGQSVRLSGDGGRFVLGDVTGGCVKIYSEDKTTRVWNQLGNKISEGYGGTAVDLSYDGTTVTYSAMSTTNKGTVYQYRWDGTFWMPSLSELTDSFNGNHFGRRIFVTNDASKIFVESNSEFQLYRWNVPRASLAFNGTRIIRRQVDETYNYDYAITSSNVVTVGVVNEAVTNDYLIKYIVTENGQSDVAYQLVSVSGELLQLGLNIQNLDDSSTPNNHGWSSSMSGDGMYFILGSPGYDNDRGMVKIYAFNPVTIKWDVMTSINGPNVGGRFGHSVSFSKNGSRVAIGAPDHGVGLVRVYEYSSSTWSQLGSDMTGTTDGKFGWSVSLNNNGSRVAVGEPRKAFSPNTGAGGVHTYVYSDDWTSESSLSFTNNQIEHQLGYDVAISSPSGGDDVVVCSAPTAGPGYVKISSYIGGKVPIFAQPITFGERFGWCLSISDDGNTFAAGAPFYDNKRGRVIVFDATTLPPTVKGSPIIGANVNDELGSSIHLIGNGTKIMIYTKEGRVTNYTYENSEWVIISSEVITSTDLTGNFGYSLSSSTDGSRMVITSPLSQEGSGIVQVYSDETSQIQNSDFVPPFITLNGPALHRHLLNTTYIDLGVRRDDALPEFTTQGTVNANVAGSYILTYSTQDVAGNISNTVSRIVDVIDPGAENNKLISIDGSNSGQNNSTIQLAASGKRVAVCTGVLPEKYISSMRPIDKSIGVQGTVKVFDLDETQYPPVPIQYGQTLTDEERYFGTSINLSQDGTKLSVMSSLDSSSAKISVYGIDGNVYAPLPAPLLRSEASSTTNNTFILPSRYYGFHDYAPSGTHIFGEPDVNTGRIGNFMRYKNNSLASSADGRIIAIGKPSQSDGTGGGVSVYKQASGTTTVENFAIQGAELSPESGVFNTGCDISEDGSKLIVSTDRTYIYRLDQSGYVKEAEFTGVDVGVNAISGDGSTAAYSVAGELDTPITLTGGDRISIEYGETWNDPDVGLAGVNIIGSVNNSVVGDHYIRYQTATQTKVRVVTVQSERSLKKSSVVSQNVPYGPNFAGWTGTWRSRDFELFQADFTHPKPHLSSSVNISIKLNGQIPVSGNLQFIRMHVFVYEDGIIGNLGSSSATLDFDSNGSGQGVSYSTTQGTVFTDNVVTLRSYFRCKPGDRVYLHLRLYNTFFSTFDAEVTIDLDPDLQSVRIPTVSLTGFAENTIDVGEDFTDPGFTSDSSSDTLTKVVDPGFPASTQGIYPIVYQATSYEGINGYAVRYVNVEQPPSVNIVKYQGNTWNPLGNTISIPVSTQSYTSGDMVLSEDGTRIVFSRYIEGEGYVYTYEYSQLVYPPSWVQYGSTIELNDRSTDSPGFSLAMSGNGQRIVIGSPVTDVTNLELGEVYIYDYVDGDWQRRSENFAALTTTGFGAVSHSLKSYGKSVDTSKDGTHIVVGSPPHVSVFELSSGSYVLKGAPLTRDASETEFGTNVSISNDGNTFAADTNTGVVYYNYTNNTWTEHGSGVSTGTSNSGVGLNGDGTKVLAIGTTLKLVTPQTVEVEAPWVKMGSIITPDHITQPYEDVHADTRTPGTRISPGTFASNPPAAFMGLVVDLSHDGLTLAIGMPFLEMQTQGVTTTRGAAIVFQWNDTTETWDPLGDLIVPYYEYNNSLYKMYNGYEADANTRATASDNLNIEAEKTGYNGASISLSGDGQYLCVGSPGYLPNPIDQSPNMHALPNQAGLSSWTLFRRNADWAPFTPTATAPEYIYYSRGWEPVVTKYSDISESLEHTQKDSDYDEIKRELLGLGVKVSFDGSFVLYDTRTDGVKVLAIGEKEIINGMQLPSPNTFGRYDVHDKAFGAMVPQATSTSTDIDFREYEMNGVVSIPDWSSTVNGQDHLDATLPTHPETPNAPTNPSWRRVPILHPQSPLLGLGGITNPLNLDVTGSGAQLPITGTAPEDSLHYFAGENRVPNSSYADGIMRGSTNFGFGEILSTSKDCKFMVTRRHLWGEFAAAGVGNWEGGSGTEGLKAKSHIKNLVDHPNFVPNGPEYKNFLTDFHSFSEVYVYYRDSPTADWVQRGSTNQLRALRYAELNKKYLVPTNHIYRCLFDVPTDTLMNNTEADVAKHCGLVLWMENFGTEAKISDDGMTLLISNFIGVPADYQLNEPGSRTSGDAERWESFMPLDEMNDFGNAIYYYKYNTTTSAWEPKPHKTLSADTYVETSFEDNYNEEFGTMLPTASVGSSFTTLPSGIGVIKDAYFDVNNVDHTQAPYPIFASYFDHRMRSSDILASGSVIPTWFTSRKKKNLDYTSQFARSVSLSGNGDIVAVCEPNWNPIFCDDDIGNSLGRTPDSEYQRIHPDFCRSIVTTGTVGSRKDYNSEDDYFEPYRNSSYQYRYMEPNLSRARGGQMSYWRPLRPIYPSSTYYVYPPFESSKLVATGHRAAVRPGDCGRVLFMKWNEQEGIIDVDRSLPPFYSIQLLNYVEDDVREKRHEINTPESTTAGKGGFQYTIFKCELNSVGDEVTFFASYPSDFMERHGITDERVGIYTFKLTDAVDITNLSDAQIAELDPMSYYTTGLNNYTGMRSYYSSRPNSFQSGWTLGYTKYWKFKSKILTSQFKSQTSANTVTQTLSIARNTQLYFKGDTTLVHSGPNFDYRKQDMGTITSDQWYDPNVGATAYTPEILRDPTLTTTSNSGFPALQYSFWYPSGERREDDISEKVLSRRRYVNNWRSTNHIIPTTPQDAIQNPLDLKVYEGTDIILFRDSRNIYVFRNGVNITKSIGRGAPTFVSTGYIKLGTVLNAAYAQKAKTLVVSHYGVDGNHTGTFITMHKINEDIENYDGTYGEFETLYPVNRDAYVNNVYELDPAYTPNFSLYASPTTNAGLASYHALNDLLYESNFDRVPHLNNEKVATALSLEISENADTILFSSGSNYFDGLHYSGVYTYGSSAYSAPVAGLHEHTTIHTLTHSLTTTTLPNQWVVQKKFGGDTTSFLTDRNIFTRSPEMADSTSYSSSYMNVPSVTNGFGAYPSKFWPVSYISLSKNNNYLTISEPVFDPLGLRLGNWDGSSTIEQNEDIRMGRVTAYRLDDSTRQYDNNTSMVADVDSIIEENSPITTQTSMNLYEPVSIAVSKDGLTIAVASVIAKNVVQDDLYQSQKEFIDPHTFGHPDRMYRSWIQVYTYIDGQWTRKGNHISPGRNDIPDESTNNELFLGQFMDLSGDGSRLITTGTSFDSENSNTNSHEVYVYEFVQGVWVTTSGDVNNPERIFIRSERQYRRINPSVFPMQWIPASTYNIQDGGTFEDNFALGSISGVSISEDGSRIAISTSNYSGTDFYQYDGERWSDMSRCVEMVLLLEYHQAFHSFITTGSTSQSYNNVTNVPGSSVFSSGAYRTSNFGNIILPSDFTTNGFKVTATVTGNYVGQGGSYETLELIINNQSRFGGTTISLRPNDLVAPYLQSGTVTNNSPNYTYNNVVISRDSIYGDLYPNDELDLQVKIWRGYWSTISVDFHIEYTNSGETFLTGEPRGLNVFPYEINHNNFDYHWGADMFARSSTTINARDFENVYVDNLAGGPVNWKLLHWEVFKAELDMSAGSTRAIDTSEPHGTLTRNIYSIGGQPPYARIPHSIVSGINFSGNDVLVIERYDNAVGMTNSSEDSKIDAHEYLTPRGINFNKSRRYNPNRYPQLLVFDSTMNQVTSRTTQERSGQYYSTPGFGVRWGGTWTVPDTRNNYDPLTGTYFPVRHINGENDDSHTRDDGWWINPITGWMLLDFERPIQGSSTGDPRPQGYQDVPFSVDVSDTTVNSNNHRQPGRVVFGIPQAGEHRGKIQIFDISTRNHSQTINGTAHNTCRYNLTQVGQDIYGDQVKGRFGENVSISGDGSRVAVGNRPFYLDDGRGSNIDTGVNTKFYVYEYDSTNSEFTKTLSQGLTISKSLENQDTRSLDEFQTYFIDKVENNVYTQWGRPPCFLEQEDVDVGLDGTSLLFDKPSKIWIDSRYRESKVKLSPDGAYVVVSVFNDFMVYDIGAKTTTPWVEFGQVITDTSQVSQTIDIDEFPYSGATISQDGKTMVVPSSVVPNKFGNNSPGPWKKQFTLYDYNDDTLLWVKGTTNDVENTTIAFDGTGGGTGTDNFPNERTFLTILSSDKSRVSSLFGGATLHPSVTIAPTFRQHLPSGDQQALQWTKIRPDIHIASENLNEQQWKATRTSSDPPSERIPGFAMSNDGTKIVVGNANDTLNFLSVSDRRKSGSVSIFSYDVINARWDVQKVTVDDNSAELSTPYTPARFGHSLTLTRDGTRMVVSAPDNRNGDGDIFVFDTSTTTATKDSTLQNPGGTTEFGYSLAVSDDFTTQGITRLLVGDPYHNSGTGRIIVSEYNNDTILDDTPIHLFSDFTGGASHQTSNIFVYVNTYVTATGPSNPALTRHVVLGSRAVWISDDGNTIAYTVTVHDDIMTPGEHERIVFAKKENGQWSPKGSGIIESFSTTFSTDETPVHMWVSQGGVRDIVVFSLKPFSGGGTTRLHSFYYDETNDVWKEQSLGLGDYTGFVFTTSSMISNITGSSGNKYFGYEHTVSMSKSGDKIVYLEKTDRTAPMGASWSGTWGAGIQTFVWNDTVDTNGRHKGFDPAPPGATNDNSLLTFADTIDGTARVTTAPDGSSLRMSADGSLLVVVTLEMDPTQTTSIRSNSYTEIWTLQWNTSTKEWDTLHKFSFAHYVTYSSPIDPALTVPGVSVSDDGSRFIVEYFIGYRDRRVSVFDYDRTNPPSLVHTFPILDVDNASIHPSSYRYFDSYGSEHFYGYNRCARLSGDGTKIYQKTVVGPDLSTPDRTERVQEFDASDGTLLKTLGERSRDTVGHDPECDFAISTNSTETSILISEPFAMHTDWKLRGKFDIYEIPELKFTATGFSGGTNTYITAGNSVETFADKSFGQQIRFGESIDVSGDGNHLIASRFGKFTIPGSGEDVRDYYIAGGGIEIAEKWNRDTTTGVWELEANNRIKTGTDISTALYTPEWAVGDEDWYTTLSEGQYSRFHFFDDDAPKKPNVKISDSGELYMIGMASLKEPGPLVTTNPRSGATSNVRHSSNVSVYKTFQDLTPIITLNGDNIVDIGQGIIYVDQGATSDVSTDVVVTTSNVNTDIIGNYVVRYETTRNGLTNFIDRTVRVKVVSVPPVVTLIGNATITLEQPTTYTEPDPPVTFSGGVLETYGDAPDGSAVGVFTIRYQVRNALGIAIAERTVTILPDTTEPAVTKLGGDITHKYNTTYRDPSYVGSDGNEEVTTTTPSYVRTITDVGQYRGTTKITYSAVDPAGNVGTETRNVDVKDVMEATALEQQLDNSYYSTISGDGSRIAIVTNDVVLYDLPSTFVDEWSGFESMEGQMVKLSSDGQIIAFTASDGVRVYAYNVNSGSWDERLAVPSRFVQLGASAYRIEMSDDGSTISVSYPGGNSQYIEEVVVFRWNGSEYVEEHSIANGTYEATGLGTVMSLSSDGNRLALGIPSASSEGTTSSITSPSPFLGLATRSPTLKGVIQLSNTYKLTSFRQHGQNNTMYWQLTLGARWTATWKWYIYGPRWGGADDMRLIYYATNPITAYQASVHNGYNNFYEFWQGDTHQIRDNNDIYRKTQKVYYGTSRWLDVEVSYDNGVMTSTVRDKTRLVSTLTHDFGTAHQNLYDIPTYIGFSGRTGGVTSSQYISGINITSAASNLGEIEVYERSGGSWSQLGQTIGGGRSYQKLGSSVKLSGDGSTLVNVNDTHDANNQKVSVFSLSNGVWTKNPTLISNLKSRTLLGDSNDLVDISSDGTLLIYAEGRGTETYTTHPNGLSTKYIDGFKLENGQYIPVLLIQETSTTSSLSTNRVEVSNDGSKVLIQADDQVAVYNVTETVFNPVITLNYRDDLDTMVTVSGTYTEGGATSDVTDGSAVVVGGETVTNTAGTYRVTYSVKDNNTGKSAHRTRTVIIIQ